MAKIIKKKATFQRWESRTGNDKYYRICQSMFTSAPWLDLSIYAHEVYSLMKQKYTRNDSKGTDNKDDISLTYTETNAVMNKKTFTKALDELIEHGFIELIILGRIVRKTNIYGFSEMWKHYGTSNFHITPRPRVIKQDMLKAIK